MHLEEAKPSYRARLQSNIILNKFCLSICKYLATVARCQIFRPRLPNLFNECGLYTAQGVIEIKKVLNYEKNHLHLIFKRISISISILECWLWRKIKQYSQYFAFTSFFCCTFFDFFLDFFRFSDPLWIWRDNFLVFWEIKNFKSS